MPIRQKRSEIEEAYLGNTDPAERTEYDTSSQALARGIMALASAVGARGATGALGGAAGAETAAPPTPQTREVSLYDDRTDRPEMKAKDYLVRALIPLGAGVLGGLGGGNRGAMVGAKAGLEALKEEEDYTKKRYDSLEDAKSKQRSNVITAKVLRELDDKYGTGPGGRNKARFILEPVLDPQTKRVYYRKWDREAGELTTIDGAGNLVPYSKDLYDRLRPAGDGTVSETGAPPATPSPAIAAPKTFAEADTGGKVPGKVGAMTIKSSGLTDQPPTKLPAQVKEPGGKTAPLAPSPRPQPADIQQFVKIPDDLEPSDYDSILKEFRQGLKPQIADFNARISKHAAEMENPDPQGRENEIDARRRVANAEKQLGKIEKDRADFDRRAAEKIAEIQSKKVDAEKRDKRATASATKPDKGAVKASNEAKYRFNILNTNLDKLKGLVEKHGTFDVLGPEGDTMDKLIYEAAIDYAKLVDPDSVAREGEVAAAQKYMLKFRRNMGITTSKKTALAQIKEYKDGLADRLKARESAGAGTGGAIDVDKMSDQEVDAELRKRGLLK